ncbi:MAG: RdgB/HAM1 family non-canonical purine NTP pyrophosphatase [Terrimicrobiaceae bacterium]|jgi:XTP/dITP diphosphohydrolase
MPDTDAPAIPLLAATRNAHKVGEIRAILGPRFLVRDLACLPDMPEAEETGATFEENAALKAVAISLHFGGWVIADDSGLEVDALGGAPGVHSARYAGEKSNDAANNALLLRRLLPFHGDERSARFRCVIVLARHGRKLAAFSGAVEGAIIGSPRGEGGFGYDPLFVPEGFGETFAQLGSEIKNGLSHRAKALQALEKSMKNHA